MEVVLRGLQQCVRLFGSHGASQECITRASQVHSGVLGGDVDSSVPKHSSWASSCVGSTRGSPAVQRLAHPVSSSMRHGSGWVWGFTSSCN